MSVVLLIIALAIILVSAELFTNGVEWFGRRYELGEGAVGSVLAAVGTALPETLIPIIAILFTGTEASDDIGIGAILGAPFMLATIAMVVTAVAVVVFYWRKRRPLAVTVNEGIMRRDLSHFLIAYGLAMARGRRARPRAPLRRWPSPSCSSTATTCGRRSRPRATSARTPSRCTSTAHPEMPHTYRIYLQIGAALAGIILGRRDLRAARSRR